MTTPHGGGSDPRNDPQRDGGLPRYEPTFHPEDRPGFGSEPGNNTGSGQGNPFTQPDPYGSYGAAEYPGYQGMNEYNENATTQGTGRVDVIDAIKWGFKATFKNAVLWILGAVVVFVGVAVIAGGIGFIIGENETGQLIFQLLVAVASLFVTPIVYRLALHQIDDPDTGWGHIGKDVHYAPTILVGLVIQVITAIFGAIVMFSFVGGAFFSIGNFETMSDEQLMGFLGSMVMALVILMVVAVLIQPLYMLMQWFAADGKTDFAGSFGAGFRAGKANWLSLIGFNILMGIIALVAVLLTLGLASVVVIPAMGLATAHAYRQASGGQVPAA